MDFGFREKELLDRAEMGEGARKLLAGCLGLLSTIRQTVVAETPLISNALGWAGKVL
jgi:hypothetical protein